jgi:uroporphyrinogen III methyltransferase/synthase
MSASGNREEKSGMVYLVGAGPGDPGLITVRGLQLIREAEVLVYDYLAGDELLAEAGEHTEIIYVGKKGGDHTLSQEGINRLLVEKAREGKKVVRLKGGDPFIFGRGAEEAEVLWDEGIQVEVVPGVTSAIAAPAYAGIPLTHRSHTSSVAFVTGHEDPTKEVSSVHWKELAKGVGTLVFLMGMRNLPNIVANLTANGLEADTPAALVRWGTTPQQQTLTGTLGDIAEKAREANFTAPVIIVVGSVTGLRDKLNWFEKRPLFGRSILVTRTREQASQFARLLSDAGARVVEFPTIRIVPPDSWDELDAQIRALQSYQWLIFTSANGVINFHQRLLACDRDARDLQGIKVCAIGPATAEAVEERLGFKPELIPGEYRAEEIIEAFRNLGVKGLKILLPRAEVAREILPRQLSEMGADIRVVTAYRTVVPREKEGDLTAMLEEGSLDMVTFASSSTVENFVEIAGRDRLTELKGKVAIACIGPITAEKARSYGLKVDVQPEEYTIPALAQAIIEYYSA